MAKPRVFICSDVFGDDKDDGQSFIRLLLYSNLLDLRGFSCSYPEANINATFLTSLVVDHFARDMQFLRSVDPAYPSAAQIAAIIYQGKGTTGAPGSGSDTAGSNALIAEALAASPSDPLWVLNWGIYGDLAQALFDDPSIAPNIRVYGISPTSGYNHDADSAAADWITTRLAPGQSLEDLWFIANNSTFRGMYCGASGENIPDRNWAPQHAAGRGALGDFYLDFTWDLAWDGSNSGAKEGDTPSLLFVLDNHLVRGHGDNPAHADGGWGGQFVKDAALGNNYWKDIPSGQTLGSFAGANTVRVHQTDIWNDFAAKLSLLGRSTFLAGETFANVTSGGSLAGRTSHPSGHTWTNWRADRPFNYVNSGNMDYAVGTVGGGSGVFYIDAALTENDYTVEGIVNPTGASAGMGIMLSADGTAAGGDGRFYLFGMDTGSPYDWRITKNINSADENNATVSQASTMSVSAFSTYRMRLRKRGMVLTMDAREPGFVDGWQPIMTWTDPGTPMPAGGGPGIRGTNLFRSGLIFARTNDGIVGATYHADGGDAVAATGMVGGSGFSATVAITEASDAVAAIGAVAISGSLATIESDSDASAGTVTIVGTAAISEPGDALTMTGSVGAGAGVIAVEAADTLVSAGTVRIAGTASIAEAADTVSASSTSFIGGVAVSAEARDTVVATGAVAIAGTASFAEAHDATVSGGVARVGATLALTEGNDALIAVGTVRIAGAVAIVEGNDALASGGQSSVTGSIAANDNADMVTATGAVRVNGNMNVAQAGDSIVSTGVLGITGAVDFVEVADWVAATGVVITPPTFRRPPPSRQFDAPRDRIWRAA